MLGEHKNILKEERNYIWREYYTRTEWGKRKDKRLMNHFETLEGKGD